MHRWTSLIGAMMLVLMLWTSGAAYAAERFDCIPTTAATVDHFDGDQDQVPSSPDQGAAHCHSGCSGHQIAAPTSHASLGFGSPKQVAPLAWRESGVPGRGPDNELRPPIA